MSLTKYINSKVDKIILIILYISLLFGFFLNENSSGGAEWDFNKLSILIQSFAENFEYTFNNYKNFEVSHYPYYYIFLSWILRVSGSFVILKIIILHMSIILPFLFYKIIKIKFPKISKKHLLILSGVIFLSPYFRSSAVWGMSDNIALIFFSLSILFYLKIESFKSKSVKKIFYIFLQVLCLAIASYVRQYYAILFLFFAVKLILSLDLKETIFYIFINLIFAIPALISTYGDNNLSYSMNFFTNNLLSNLILFVTIFSFYLIPLYADKKNIMKIINYYTKNMIIFIILLTFSIFLFFIFNYEQPFGGGIFYKIIKLSEIPSLLIVVIFFALLLIFHFIKDDIFNNLLILIPVSMFSLIAAIFQKYFDPISIILIFSLFKSEVILNYINDLNINLKFLYGYYATFLLGSIIFYS